MNGTRKKTFTKLPHKERIAAWRILLNVYVVVEYHLVCGKRWMQMERIVDSRTSSLMGSDKKLLLKALPDKLSGVVRPEISATVVKLWKVKYLLYFPVKFSYYKLQKQNPISCLKFSITFLFFQGF